MSVPYAEKFVFFPPRPEGSVPPDAIGSFVGFWGQYKYNGTRQMIFVHPDGTIELYGRHQKPHARVFYELSPELEASIRKLKLPRGKWHVLDSELLHKKTENLRDRTVLFDSLVYNGEYLVGTTYRERLEILRSVCRKPRKRETVTGRKIALHITDHLWLVPTFVKSLGDRFEDLLDMDEIEGLMLKDPEGVLEFGVAEKNNSAWMARCRKPTKNYSF